jgi:hypothetical protein
MEGMTDFRNQSVRVLDRWKRPGMIPMSPALVIQRTITTPPVL